MIAYLTFSKICRQTRFSEHNGRRYQAKPRLLYLDLVGLVYLSDGQGFFFVSPTPDPGLLLLVEFTSSKYEVREIRQSV